MGELSRLLRRLGALARRDRLDDNLAEEMRQHVALRRDALVRDGMDPRDAEWEARRLFGNLTAIREETRDMGGFPSFETLVQDVRYGARMLRRSRAFSATAILSLAIGIGASAAVFSLANTVLLGKLPVPDPDALVVLRWFNTGDFPFASLNGYGSQSNGENSSTSFSLLAFEEVRKGAAEVVDTVGFADLYRVNVAADGRPEVEPAQVVSDNYYSVLGVRAAAGRLIGPADLAAQAPPVAVISYEYWRRRFGRSPDAVGRPLVVNNIPVTIVGVTERGFSGTLQVGQQPAISLPLSLYGTVTRGDNPKSPDSWWVLMMGRLKPGWTAAAVQPRIDAIVKQTVRGVRPAIDAAGLPRVTVDPGSRGQNEARQTMREPLEAMAWVVAIVLLVACANVSTLLLARGRARLRELAVRVAIGASRRRVVRQLLTESLLLAGIGSAIGLTVANWLTTVLASALVTGGTGSEVQLQAGLDWRVVSFTMVLAFACSVAFGLAPALRSTDVTIAAGLQEAGRGGAAGGQRTRLGAALVVVQVALSMLLLSIAGLLAYSVRNLQNVTPGFDPHNVLVFGVDPQQNGYDEARVRQTLDAALLRLRALPGVRGASLSATGSSRIRRRSAWRRGSTRWPRRPAARAPRSSCGSIACGGRSWTKRSSPRWGSGCCAGARSRRVTRRRPRPPRSSTRRWRNSCLARATWSDGSSGWDCAATRRCRSSASRRMRDTRRCAPPRRRPRISATGNNRHRASRSRCGPPATRRRWPRRSGRRCARSIRRSRW